MASIKLAYGTSNQTITITAASLANGSARQSTEVSNTSNLFLDAQVGGKVTLNSTGVSATGTISIYAFAAADGGTIRSEGAGASDAAITLHDPCNAPLLGTFTANANSDVVEFSVLSVAKAFGGKLPEKWGVILQNNSGAALDSTAGNHSFHYQGITATVA